MRILYLGATDGTARHRAETLKRLGHEVKVIFPDTLVPGGAFLKRLHHESGGLLCAERVASRIRDIIGNEQFDFTWVGGGRYVGPSLIRWLQQRFGPVLNYNNDDPLGNRDRFSWSLYRQAVPAYDLLIYHREINVNEAYARGAKRAMWTYSMIDEVDVAPFPMSDEERARGQSDVLFIGTWMPERGPFMAHLVERGVPLTIIGNRWEKAREWNIIKSSWKAKGTTNYKDYAAKIMSAKVCLGLLSKENRDLHTRRSMEIPYLGGLLCAERTTDHSALYEEDKEAVFWSDANECADKCLLLLQNDVMRRDIALKGRERCLKNGNFNEPIMNSLLEIALGRQPVPLTALNPAQKSNDFLPNRDSHGF